MDAKIRWDETSAQQFGDLADNVVHNATEAMNSAITADSSADLAVASLNTISMTTGATEFSAATNYAQYQAAISPLTYRVYRRKTAGISATDPSVDPTNWVPVGDSDLVLLGVSTTAGAAVLDTGAVFTGNYDSYLVVGKIRPSVNGEMAYMTMKINGSYGGSNYRAAAIVNAYTTSANTAASFGTSGAANIQLSPSIAGGTTGGFDFDMVVSDPTSVTRAHNVHWSGGVGATPAMAFGTGGYTVQGNPLTDLRFFCGSGNIIGTIWVYGRRKA